MNAEQQPKPWNGDPETWEGDPGDLAEWDVVLAEDHDFCERLFMSKQEAYNVGWELGYKAAQKRLSATEAAT